MGYTALAILPLALNAEGALLLFSSSFLICQCNVMSVGFPTVRTHFMILHKLWGDITSVPHLATHRPRLPPKAYYSRVMVVSLECFLLMCNPSMHSVFTQTENVQPVRVNKMPFIDLALAYTSKFLMFSWP